MQLAFVTGSSSAQASSPQQVPAHPRQSSNSQPSSLTVCRRWRNSALAAAILHVVRLGHAAKRARHGGRHQVAEPICLCATADRMEGEQCTRADVLRPAVRDVAVSSAAWNLSGFLGINLWPKRGKEAASVAFADDGVPEDEGLPPESELEALRKELGDNRRKMGLLGTREMGAGNQKDVSFHAQGVLAEKKIEEVFTSGGLGTNEAVIKTAIDQKKAKKVTVILPQSLSKQDEKMIELLTKFKKCGGRLIENPGRDGMTLQKAAVECNREILKEVSTVTIWATRKSEKYQQMQREAEEQKVLAKIYYIDPAAEEPNTV